MRDGQDMMFLAEDEIKEEIEEVSDSNEVAEFRQVLRDENIDIPITEARGMSDISR